MKKFLASLFLLLPFSVFSIEPVHLTIGYEGRKIYHGSEKLMIFACETNAQHITACWEFNLNTEKSSHSYAGKYGKGEPKSFYVGSLGNTFTKINLVRNGEFASFMNGGTMFTGTLVRVVNGIEVTNNYIDYTENSVVTNTYANQGYNTAHENKYTNDFDFTEYNRKIKDGVMTVYPYNVKYAGIHTYDDIYFSWKTVISNIYPNSSQEILLGEPDYGTFNGGIDTGKCFMFAYLGQQGAESGDAAFGLVEDYGRPFINIQCNNTNGLWNITSNANERTSSNIVNADYLAKMVVDNSAWGATGVSFNAYFSSINLTNTFISLVNPQFNTRMVLLTENRFDFPFRSYITSGESQKSLIYGDTGTYTLQGSINTDEGSYVPVRVFRLGFTRGYTVPISWETQYSCQDRIFYLEYYFTHIVNSHGYEYIQKFLNEGMNVKREYAENNYFLDYNAYANQGDFAIGGIYFIDGNNHDYSAATITNTYDDYSMKFTNNVLSTKTYEIYDIEGNKTEYIRYTPYDLDVGYKEILNEDTATNGFIEIESRDCIKYQYPFQLYALYQDDTKGHICCYCVTPCGFSQGGNLLLHFPGVAERGKYSKYYVYSFNSRETSHPYDAAKAKLLKLEYGY